MEKAIELNEKTSVQLWGVLASLPLVLGAGVWLAVIYTDGQAHATQIKQLDMRIDKLDGRIDNEYNLLMDIRDRLIRLEQHNKDSGGIK